MLHFLFDRFRIVSFIILLHIVYRSQIIATVIFYILYYSENSSLIFSFFICKIFISEKHLGRFKPHAQIISFIPTKYAAEFFV